MTAPFVPPGAVQYDDDGNAIPQPEPGSDLADFIHILEYGRSRGFRIGPTVRVGKIVVSVRDLRQKEGAGKELPPDPGVWAEHGYDPESE